LKKLVAGFIRGEVQPQLDSGGDRLEHLRSLAASLPAAERDFLDQRVGKLIQWHGRSLSLLPLLGLMLDEEATP
jgi:hypothetical protein